MSKTIEELAIEYIIARDKWLEAKEAFSRSFSENPCIAEQAQVKLRGPYAHTYRCFEFTRACREASDKFTGSPPVEWGIGQGSCAGCLKTLEFYELKSNAAIHKGHCHASLLKAVRRKLSE